MDLPSLLARLARSQPDAPALILGEQRVDFATLDAEMDRVAAALQRDGARPNDVVALCGTSSIRYVTIFLGALRAGLAVAPLSPTATAQQLTDMLLDAGPRHAFLDAHVAAALATAWPAHAKVTRVQLDEERPDPGFIPWNRWIAGAPEHPDPVAIDPQWPFNIIYSSGTTGRPKGIVQPHAMRFSQIWRSAAVGYGPGTVTLIATPLYSNTTLVSLIPALARGSCVVLCPRFDCATYLDLAVRHGVTHTMLVPTQYQRLMDFPDFDRYDLSRFQAKFCTSAPFRADLKAEVLRRWPGGLTEHYGLTEGGGACVLPAHLHPDKLHTVGRPADGHDIRLIDSEGRELPRKAGLSGEIVGRSPGMMTGYHHRPEETAAVQWFDAEGQRFIRTGDIGRFDADGFLILVDRRKDVIISGGFNVYPSDLEAALAQHPEVAECAVFGLPSRRWGETPVACVVARPGATIDTEALRTSVNATLGKTQRLAEVRVVASLPRSEIGKVLRRELRAGWRPAEMP